MGDIIISSKSVRVTLFHGQMISTYMWIPKSQFKRLRAFEAELLKRTRSEFLRCAKEMQGRKMQGRVKQ
jgi:hypothetical protein